ncbi:zinc dependent phospholipase C family protein [Dyadobacter sandarakinus]|uniref:Integrase n=1 Tax=Dyadobacter sandarakinus TaxID=2747268 RepID=A0ABX7I248_9BACT|nr:zinc dependent phospholipase C family protein [Dyadobacter sandarakinus]QRQ99591.1 integrase [Dyadobacter sandarakinus]
MFRLPAAMQVFYKKHIDYITENATNPDKRRYAVAGEAERHFIDLDVYGDSVFYFLPPSWPKAVERVGEDSLRKHGIVPWHIQLAAFQLTEAFKMRDLTRVLRLSAELGHYIADAHVPLHTTSNYNGQKTRQTGIHGFWESRLPELFAEQYEFWEGPAVYQENIMLAAWQAVRESSEARDSVLSFEKILTGTFASDKKYSYELRNNVLTRSYSREFSEQYHAMLAGQVERRMRASIRMTGDIWYTCWINAGQPDLASLTEIKPQATPEKEEETSWIRRLLHIRPEADD